MAKKALIPTTDTWVVILSVCIPRPPCAFEPRASPQCWAGVSPVLCEPARGRSTTELPQGMRHQNKVFLSLFFLHYFSQMLIEINRCLTSPQALESFLGRSCSATNVILRFFPSLVIFIRMELFALRIFLNLLLPYESLSTERIHSLLCSYFQCWRLKILEKYFKLLFKDHCHHCKIHIRCYTGTVTIPCCHINKIQQ